MMKFALLLIAASYVLAAGDKSYFAPYGSGVGDITIGRCDDCSASYAAFPFTFYGTSYPGLYVNNNGLITFSSPTGQYTPVGMSGAYFPSIAPYWGDVDTGACGQVSYRSTADPTLLATWSARIPGGGFAGVSAFVATWNDVGYFASKCNKINSFQAILITNVTHSWVFLNYGDLQWTTGDASGGSNGLGGTPASIGFSAGNGVTYVQTPESLTGAVVNTPNFVTLVSATVIVLPPTPPATVCGNGITEGTEQCDGGACCSSTCSFVASGSVCRTSAGVCDVAETCTGAASSCPADNVAASGSVCRAAAGDCDLAETCDGSATTCPVDNVAARGTVCRAAVDSCDLTETCDGSATSCPVDELSMTTSCFCARQSLGDGEMGYFCNPNGGFYQCLGGVFAPQSRSQNCALGTHCGCSVGAECSCNLAKSPCVFLADSQQC